MSDRVLYWISGSTPSWRVMLALTLKGLTFSSRRLDHSAGENKRPAYLALNPKGQVPTLIDGDIVLRESMAILAWLDRAYPQRPIWGSDATTSARVWQHVMLMEVDLNPAIQTAARSLLQGRSIPHRTVEVLLSGADTLANTLKERRFLGGDTAMANDIWLYPALHWIARGADVSADAPDSVLRLTHDRPALAQWMDRMTALPGVADTYPPHWRKKHDA